MLLFTDIISGDELFSDAFPLYVIALYAHMLTLIGTHRKEIDDIVYEVDCQNMTVKPGADVDIGRTLFSYQLSSFYWTNCPGANPSAEEAEDAVEDGMITVNNVVYSFRLQSTGFDKKGFLTYLKVGDISVREFVQY